jgi:hypothetical protein
VPPIGRGKELVATDPTSEGHPNRQVALPKAPPECGHVIRLPAQYPDGGHADRPSLGWELKLGAIAEAIALKLEGVEDSAGIHEISTVSPSIGIGIREPMRR